MSGWDVSDADMPNTPRPPRGDVPELPDGALDALLSDDLITDEAFTGLRPAAALLAALNAGPAGCELAGHARALAEFRNRGGKPVSSRRSARRRPPLLTSVLTVKAAAAAAAAAAALGGAATAAYTGSLPAPAQRLAHTMIGAPPPGPSHGPGTPHASPTRPQTSPSGPDATGPAASGLCTAYAHAKTHGSAAQQATAFRNLAAAAGGAARIAAYCAAVPAPGSPEPGRQAPTHPAGPPAQASRPAGPPVPRPAGKPTALPAPHPDGKPSSAPSHPSGKPSSTPGRP